MVVTLRKTFVLIVMALVMLAGLLGWSIQMGRSASPHQSSSIHSTQTALNSPKSFCPPPPFICH